jgi:alpha-tubulin suppressor-like RCC1 family protein
VWGCQGKDKKVEPLPVPEEQGAPLKISKLATARNVCVGGRATCAVDLHGVLRCWGNNDSGQLGRGTITVGVSDPEPVPVGWWQP